MEDRTVGAPPISKILSSINKKRNEAEKLTEFAIDKKKYIKREAKEKDKKYGELGNIIKNTRTELLKKGLDYKTIDKLLKQDVKDNKKSIKSTHKAIYPIVITKSTKSIILK